MSYFIKNTFDKYDILKKDIRQKGRVYLCKYKMVVLVYKL
jgi:hypothetical protein